MHTSFNPVCRVVAGSDREFSGMNYPTGTMRHSIGTYHSNSIIEKKQAVFKKLTASTYFLKEKAFYHTLLKLYPIAKNKAL